MKLKHTIQGLCAILVLATPVNAQSGVILNGSANVVHGATMKIAGRTVTLANIIVPMPGTSCLLRGRTHDCGKLSRAGLMDITAGATVSCEPASEATFLCTAEGYDLGYGLIHAGWALPGESAPAHYRRKMQDAKIRSRGLWRAKTADGTSPFTMSLRR